MFTNAKTIVYDNDDYMDDEEEDDVNKCRNQH
jgi:hypothetical protein